MTRPTIDAAGELPDLAPGLTLLRQPADGTTALHRLVLAALRRRRGRAYWIDSRNQAATTALYDLCERPGELDGLRIARGFTAYQHHALVKRVVRLVTPATSLVVVPRLVSLYRDDDVPDWEANRLLDATLETLSALADGAGLAVLASTTADDAKADRIAAHADAEIEGRQTSQGVAYEGEGGRTTLYWHRNYWQTTVPYWVDLLGAVDEAAPRSKPVAVGEAPPVRSRAWARPGEVAD